jgi:excisionase family DNA binding protein
MILDPISTSEAAQILDLSPNRVRVLAAKGQLPAEKIGDRWLVERWAVKNRAESGALSGRLFEPHNAWALLFLASGLGVDGIDPSVRSRLRRALAVEGLVGLLPRLARRAETRYFKVHAGEVPHLLEDRSLVRSGISAVGEYGIDLVPGHEVDCYLQASQFETFAADHALITAGPANLRVRLVPDGAWRFLAGRELAPFAAVCLDLATEEDARSRFVGRYLLEGLHADLLDPKRSKTSQVNA